MVRDMLDGPFERLKRWLFGEVLPLWQERGIDRVRGGFHERLDAEAQPIKNIPRRTRVVARQIYSFAAAGRLGWSGEWLATVNHGADNLFGVCLKDDGLVVSTYSVDEAPANPAFDLYDHAFALFALAELASTEVWGERAQVASRAMLNEMNAQFAAPKGGWFDSATELNLLRSNPHMHLLEAFLALESATGMKTWLDQADQIVELAERYFICSQTGALHEYFDLDWKFYPDERGQIVEPGHQFEWSWLFHTWNQRSENSRPSIKVAADHLVEIGEKFGITKRSMAMDELWSDLTPKAKTSRTWPQTERVKACVMQAELASDPQEIIIWESRAADAIDAILRFAHPSGYTGLWYDRILPNGQPVIEPAPASTLYHIMCAAEVVDRYLAKSRASSYKE